jgi:hypothetical protein
MGTSPCFSCASIYGGTDSVPGVRDGRFVAIPLVPGRLDSDKSGDVEPFDGACTVYGWHECEVQLPDGKRPQYASGPAKPLPALLPPDTTDYSDSFKIPPVFMV